MPLRPAPAAVGAALALLFGLRTRELGPPEALAELLGLSAAYIRWRDTYAPLHPELFVALADAAWLDESLLRALGNDTDPFAALRDLSTPEGAGVFSLPLFTDGFCRKLVEEIAHFEQSGRRVAFPNSMNEYGVVLDEMGLGDLATQLRSRVLGPLAAALYGRPPPAACVRGEAPEVRDAQVSEEEGLSSAAVAETAAAAAAAAAAASCCVEHHAFTIRYEAVAQRGLDMHHDDSDLTLNACLSVEGSVEGSALAFCGLVGDADHRRFRFSLQHRVGRAVIHLGAQRHGAEDVFRGVRQNLLLWGRSHPRARGHRPPSSARRHPRELPPDARCLSWTHDGDFTDYIPLPPAALEKRREREHVERLLRLAREASDAQISRMPREQQPLARLLRQLAAAEEEEEEAPTTQDQLAGAQASGVALATQQEHLAQADP